MNDKELLQQIKNRINDLFGFEKAPDDAMYYMRKDQNEFNTLKMS